VSLCIYPHVANTLLERVERGRCISNMKAIVQSFLTFQHVVLARCLFDTPLGFAELLVAATVLAKLRPGLCRSTRLERFTKAVTVGFSAMLGTGGHVRQLLHEVPPAGEGWGSAASTEMFSRRQGPICLFPVALKAFGESTRPGDSFPSSRSPCSLPLKVLWKVPCALES
jgi:hypothetical protein